MRIGDILTEPVVVASEETMAVEIAQAMLDRRIGGIPIVDSEGLLVGIVTESDFAGTEQSVPLAVPTAPASERLPGVGRGRQLRTHRRRGSRASPTGEIRTSPVVTAEEHEAVQDVVERMIEHDVGRVPIVRGWELIGIVSRHDILKLVAGRLATGD